MWTLREFCEQTELEQEDNSVLICGGRYHEGKTQILISIQDRDGFPVDTYVPASALLALVLRVVGSIPPFKEEQKFE